MRYLFMTLLCLILACGRFGGVDNPMPARTTTNSGTTYTNSTSHQTFTNSTSHNTFNNSTSTFNNSTTTPGTIKKIISYPAGVTGISDVVYDSSSQSLLLFVYDTLNNWKVTKIIKVNPSSGETLSATNITNPDFFMNYASEFTKAGDYYYGTSYGWSNGMPQSVIYKIDMSGQIVSTFPCPSTNTGGFCEGLAWDGTYLWTGASDNKKLVQFSTDGTVIKTLDNTLSSTGVGDVSLKDASHLIISHTNNLYLIDTASMAITSQLYTGYSKKGDWDDQLFWFANNSTQQLEGFYTGF